MRQWSGNTLQQVEKLKYLRVVFTSGEGRSKDIDTGFGKANAVLREFHFSVVRKQELSNTAKLSVFKSVFVPILTYGHGNGRKNINLGASAKDGIFAKRPRCDRGAYGG